MTRGETPRRQPGARCASHGDIELLETIAKDPQAFIRNQGWAAVSLDRSQGLLKLRSLYEHLQARILELIETLDAVRASPDYEIFQVAEQDAAVIEQIAAAQRGELEEESGLLKAEAERLAREVPFWRKIRRETRRRQPVARCHSHYAPRQDAPATICGWRLC